MKLLRCFLFLIFCCSALPAVAQKDYDKPIDKFGIEEAQRIVNDSPWAKPYQSTSGGAAADAAAVGREQAQNVYSGGSNPRSVSRYLGPPPVTLRLHSSEVLRKATVRLQQAAAGYDKMSADDKAKFDASRKTFLDCAICKDYYVLTLTRFRDKDARGIDEGIFQTLTLEDLKGNVKLVNDKGESRELIQFIAPKSADDSAVFFFKRTDDAGNLLITPETKEFRFVFANTFLDSRNRWAYMLPRTFDFKVSKLVVGERVLF
ncbi:MAG: hypothetical protein ACK4S4_10330 [Pyrinomonadaceae bacterium]